MSTIEDVRTEFLTQERASRGRLTAGQRYMWDIISGLAGNDDHLNVREVLNLPGGATVDSVLAVVRTLIERYAALRTQYGLDAFGEPEQRVLPSGRFAVTVVEAAGQPPGQCAGSAAESLAARSFDLAAELPVRIALVTGDGIPVRLVLVFSHMVCDGWGKMVLARKARELLAGTRPEAVFTETPWQPLDQVAYEDSPEGKTKGERAINYMTGKLAEFPERLFPAEPFEPQPERFWAGALTSPTVEPAAAALAERFGVSAPAVVMAAAFRTLHRLSGVTEFGFAMRTFNRYHLQARDAVGHYSQDMPVLMRQPDRPLADVARDVHREARNSLRCPHFWPPDIARAIARLNAERGTDFAVEAAVNYTNAVQESHLAREDAERQTPGDAARTSDFRWLFRKESEQIRFLFTSDPTGIALLADTACLSPDLIEEFLRSVEAQLVDEVG